MAVKKFEIVCPECETSSVVITPIDVERNPQYCPLCGAEVTEESGDEL